MLRNLTISTILLLNFLTSCTINIIQTDGSDDTTDPTTEEQVSPNLSIPIKGI